VASVNPDKRDGGVGARLRKLREATGMTQAGVANRAGQVDSWVRHLERGTTNPTFTKVLRYCHAIGARVYIGFDARPRGGVEIEHEPIDDIVRRLVELAGGDPVFVERICRDLYGTLVNRFTRQAMRDGDRQREWFSELMAAFLNDLANFAQDQAEGLKAHDHRRTRR
jgi:transcriptional regulator with XRE-family HTH domain